MMSRDVAISDDSYTRPCRRYSASKCSVQGVTKHNERENGLWFTISITYIMGTLTVGTPGEPREQPGKPHVMTTTVNHDSPPLSIGPNSPWVTTVYHGVHHGKLRDAVLPSILTVVHHGYPQNVPWSPSLTANTHGALRGKPWLTTVDMGLTTV